VAASYMSESSQPNLDRILAFTSLAVSVALFIVPRTPMFVTFGLILLFAALVHPSVSLAGSVGLRKRWVAVLALLLGVVVFGYLIWPSAKEHPPTASEIAAEVVRLSPKSGVRQLAPESPSGPNSATTISPHIIAPAPPQRSQRSKPSRHIAAHVDEVIRQIVVEARLTATLRTGAEIPPSTVPWIPLGGATAIAEGPAGSFPLEFVSPVVFRHQEGDRIVVVNRFAADRGSDLLSRPISMLSALTTLKIPVQVIVYGRSLDVLTLFEVSVSVNGRDPWYYRYEIGNTPIAAGQSPEITIPLKGLGGSL
jgi:hypothetical protein